MNWQLATDESIRCLSVSDQLFAFAHAYLAAAQVLCDDAVSRSFERDWPTGAVVLMNSAHAVELFLKATVLKREPTHDVEAYGHNIHALAGLYESLYPGDEFAWEIPFRNALPDSLTRKEACFVRKVSAEASIEFRYPVTKQGCQWLTLRGFEPHSFRRELRRIQDDFDRIRRTA